MTKSLLWILLILSLLGNLAWFFRREPSLSVAPRATSTPQLVQIPHLPPSQTPTRSLPIETSSPTHPDERSNILASYINLLASDLKTQEQKTEINQVLKRWLVANPDAASDWLNQHPDPVFDPAVSSAAISLLTANHLPEAIEWANSIVDPAERARTLTTIYAEAYRARKMTAEQVRTAKLPSELINHILSNNALY